MNYKRNEILNYDKLLNFEESFMLAKYVSSVVDQELGREIIIHVLEIWENVNEESKEIWVNLIERAGFYPYLKEDMKIGIQGVIRKEISRSNHLKDIHFHAKQKVLSEKIEKNNNMAISAPTSFGKSLFIEEVVASRQYDNVLIIQPTLALIDETRKKLRKYTDYNLIVNQAQLLQKKNIFILTAERVMEYKDLPDINFFIVDEFYKVSNRIKDDRIDVLNIAIEKILRHKPQSLFLTPSVDSLSKRFIEKYDVEFYKTTYSLVNSNIKKIDIDNKNQKEEKLFDLLDCLEEPTLVYVPSPRKAYNLASRYYEYLRVNQKNFNNNIVTMPMIKWIDKNVSRKWTLRNILSNGIGIHNGNIPRHMASTQLEYFEKGIINIMFVTSTLIEGVNTSAKNIIIFEMKKGKYKIDYFDYANIKGRAGRMKKHFSGNLYVFEDPPLEENFKLDVPFIDQEEVSDEVLVHLKESDISSENKERVEVIKKDIPLELLNIFKENIVSIKKQKQMYDYLVKNQEKLRDVLIWEKNIPTINELNGTLQIVNRFLGESNDKYILKLSIICRKLVLNNSLKLIIEEERQRLQKNSSKYISYEESLNIAVDNIFSIVRREAGYRIPKFLNVMYSIQKYVYENKGIDSGDYKYFSSSLENNINDPRLGFLIDFGVPSSAVKKISAIIPKEIEKESEIITFIKENKVNFMSYLDTYEMELLYKDY